MSEILELETRKNIYNLIKKNPGIKLTRIAEYLGMSLQLVNYHLSYLDQHELISIDTKRGFKQCFIKGELGEFDKKILSLLRQDIVLKIVLYLLKNPFSRHRDILKIFDFSSARITYHLRKLIVNGVIEVSVHNDKQGYKLINEKEIISLLIRYKESDIFTSIKESWEDFGPS